MLFFKKIFSLKGDKNPFEKKGPWDPCKGFNLHINVLCCQLSIMLIFNSILGHYEKFIQSMPHIVIKIIVPVVNTVLTTYLFHSFRTQQKL